MSEENEVSLNNNWHHVVTVDNLGGLKRKVNIVYDGVGTDKALNNACSYINKNATIKGFRKGNAPNRVILQYYRKDVENIAKDILANDGFLHACMEQNIVPLSTPKIENFNFKLDGSFECVVLVDQKPTINPIGYVGLQLTRQDANKDEIKNEIINEQMNKFKKEVEKEFVEFGDTIVMDFKATNPVGVEITSGVDQKFVINPGQPAPFGENLIGLKKGESSTVSAVLPENHPNAGDPFVAEITVKSVLKAEVPTYEQLKDCLNLSSVEDLDKAIDDAAQNEKMKRDRQICEESAVDKLLEINEFEVPPEWVEEEKKYFLSQIGITTPDEQMLEYANGMALRNVKRTFILDSIYDAEKQLKITQEEIEHVLKMEAERRGVSSLAFKKNLEQSKMLDALVGSIRNRKVLDFVLGQAQFVEEEVHNHIDCNCEVPENPLG